MFLYEVRIYLKFTFCCYDGKTSAINVCNVEKRKNIVFEAFDSNLMTRSASWYLEQ